MNKVNFLQFIFLSVLSLNLHAQSLLLAKEPEVTIVRVEFIEWVEKDLRLNITYSIDNQNDIDATVKAIRYEMFIMGLLVSKDYRDVSAHIEANKISYITLPVTIDTVQLFSAVPQAFLSNQLTYKVTGAVAIKGLILQIPFTKEGIFPLFSQ